MKTYQIELWSDSFHEGDWACKNLSIHLKLVEVRYLYSFIPIYSYLLSDNIMLEIIILGSYNNWDPMPEEIKDLISWGKPDFIAYDKTNKRILFAVEETAAVPTGNQALQRCERVYGSLRSKIPFWYLLGEFGLHLDGGIRRDSIWPTLLALKLSCIKNTPCVTLHYSDIKHPEDYQFGEGVDLLFTSLSLLINVNYGIKSKSLLLPLLTKQYQHMLTFIYSQWSNMVNYLPGSNLLKDPNTALSIANTALRSAPIDKTLNDLFYWPVTNKLPKSQYDNIKPGGFIKKDKLVLELESIVKEKYGYNLSSNAGSRPQHKDDIKAWISEQKALFNKHIPRNASFDLHLRDFPKSAEGNFHVTTAKNVLYLIDSWDIFLNSLQKAYPRLNSLNISNKTPAFLYISNSLKPGRIFGDPFTGQLSAFSNIFGMNMHGDKARVAIAYYPHQSHNQLFNDDKSFKSNKGIIMLRELLDYAIFLGGIFVDLKTGNIV